MLSVGIGEGPRVIPVSHAQGTTGDKLGRPEGVGDGGPGHGTALGLLPPPFRE
jgi:hypothetical protein